MSFKYWYQNRMCPSNIGTGTKIYFRYNLRSSFKKRLMGTIQNLYERLSWHFKLILTLVTSRFENTPHQFGPYKDHLSENRNLIGTIQSRIWGSNALRSIKWPGQPLLHIRIKITSWGAIVFSFAELGWGVGLAFFFTEIVYLCYAKAVYLVSMF